MNRLLTFCLPLALLTLTACGGGSDGSDKKSSETTPTVAPTVIPTVIPSAAPSISPTQEPDTPPALTERYLIEWQTPNSRIDGSVLLASDIASYTLRWTNSQTQATGEVSISGDQTQWQIELPKGDYQFEIASLDSNGRISQFVSAQ
ncbi:hypothetical protein [Motilimonas cestriensis]|uniref:hypothetical protein n=1 Tax=Motilimonas cestriensis TaxID=2742685 RepID=UPI003DA5DF6F